MYISRALFSLILLHDSLQSDLKFSKVWGQSVVNIHVLYTDVVREE